MSNQNLNQLNKSGAYFIQVAGMNNQDLFRGECDYNHLLLLLKKYLTGNTDVELLAYCLAKDQFDLLLVQEEDNGISDLMHEILFYYSEYYFEMYHVDDIVSESNYEVKFVDSVDLLEISKKMHVKLEKWLDCPYSSIRAYLYDDVPGWLNKNKIAEIYGSAIKYLEFLKQDASA